MKVKVIATTTHEDGVSFDAIKWVQGYRKKLVKGDKCATADLALANLMRKAGNA